MLLLLAVQRARRLVLAEGCGCSRISALYCECCRAGHDGSFARRKPGVALFRQAAADHSEVDLANALYVGDRMRDLEPGLALGGAAVLVPGRETPLEDIIAAEERARVAPTLATALDWFLCSN